MEADYRTRPKRSPSFQQGFKNVYGVWTERERFMKGLFSWVGYKSAAVPFCRAPERRAKASGIIGGCGILLETG